MSETHQPVGVIFDTAIELPPERRAAYLHEACAGDDSLRQRVEALLRAHELAGTFMESLAVAPGLETVVIKPAEQLGNKIDRYKLLQQIGEGGCGVVYMAEQEQPVRRRVALKVIKLGMDTKQVIARFEAERQALALMDHPNIAKVLDAGATETGRPYFVMELVRGIKITEFCDKNNLSTRERLKLFIQVCGAIQHAHQKGIIHRDIKPSNILVTLNDGVPLPMVIDFGIAKATQQRLTDKTLFTAFEQFIGTPAYMSPEQAEMNALGVDTRSDIYSLGVLLYELLTGKTPFAQQDLLQNGVEEIRRIIREVEPMRPSTRLSTMVAGELTVTANHRQVEPPKLIHAVRGELDWIVMKALDKDRGRRYETANGFARDVERYLADEPVTACPPSKIYQFGKTVRRHKFAFTLAASVQYEVLLYDLTSSYVEGKAEEIPKARFGHSRDHRPDCRQVVIALVVTPEGFPLAYEVMPGNTSDKTTLKEFLAKIQTQYGKAQRIWIMDRGIPTEEVLAEMRAADPSVHYLVGTPRSRMHQTRSQWESLAWQKIKDTVEVKLFREDQELYVVAKSGGRQEKENAMRRKKLARLLWSLRGMRRETSRDRLLLRLGAAKSKAGRAAKLVEIHLPAPLGPQKMNKTQKLEPGSFSFRLNQQALKDAELYDGHYLLRSNLTDKEPEWL